MNKKTIRRFATTTLAAMLLAAPAIALAPTAAAVSPVVVGDGPVQAVTLPAQIGTVGVRTLPADIAPQPVVVEDLDPALGIMAISADISGEVNSVKDGADFTEYNYDENGRAVFKCADLHPSVAEPIPGDDVNCYLNRSGLARPAVDVQPATVPGLDTTLGIMPISIAITTSDDDREVFACEDLDESVRVEIEGEDGKCYLDRSGLVREGDDVQPMTVPDLDPNLGIMPITIGIEPISGSANQGNPNAATWIAGALSLAAAGTTVGLLANRRRHQGA